MKLELIELKDFQAHSKRALQLSPEITTLTGATDTGKSAVIRALRWLTLNDLPGDEFVKQDTRQAEVTVHIQEGNGTQKGTYFEVKRIKGSGANIYEMDGEEFKSFSTSVPSAISTALGMSEINFQGQYDSPFWFSESAPEVSRQLNSVIDLSIIDSSLSNIASLVRKASDRKEFSEERLSKSKEQLQSLEGQRERISEFKKLKRLSNTHEEISNRADRLRNLLEDINSNQAKVLDERAYDGEALLHLAWGFRKAFRKFEVLSNLIQEIDELKTKTTPPPDFEPVKNALEGKWACRAGVEVIERMIASITSAQLRLTNSQTAVTDAETIFHKKTKGQKCPLCGNPNL